MENSQANFTHRTALSERPDRPQRKFTTVLLKLYTRNDDSQWGSDKSIGMRKMDNVRWFTPRVVGSPG